MLSFFKSIVKKNIYISKAAMFLLRKTSEKAYNLARLRKKSDLTDVLTLSGHMPFCWTHPIIDNNYYGINRVLCLYAGVNKMSDRLFIEHGLVFGSLTYDLYKTSFAKHLITFGCYRKEIISKTRTYPIETIGPYIHYANLIFSAEKIKFLKTKFGKTLLVFPSHSIKAVNVNYDMHEFINEIKKIGQQFDKVMVCLYWKDIQNGLWEVYSKEKFDVVTAGHVYDPFFLDRLKTIISLADSTMSNNIGTHIGYSVFLEKPHYIYEQDITPQISSDLRSFNRELNMRSIEDRETLMDARLLLKRTFGVFTNTITDEQREIVRYFWGTDKIKSKKELRNMIG